MPQPTQFRQRLAGKIAIVTGAGSLGAERFGAGIGKAIAILFAREGARVTLVDRDAERAQRTHVEIEAAGAKAFVIEADVTREGDCARVAEETIRCHGPPTVLVNNVGTSGGGERLDSCDLERWQQMMDVNLRSALLMSRAVVGAMIAAGGGSIINIGSIAGIRRYGTLAYGPSKAALAALSEEIAVLHGRQGIRANTVAPGHVLTPHALGLLGDSAREARRKAAPLGIEGDAWDVAAVALFLASDEARFVSGTCIPVDGGVIATGSLTAHSMISG